MKNHKQNVKFDELNFETLDLKDISKMLPNNSIDIENEKPKNQKNNNKPIKPLNKEDTELMKVLFSDELITNVQNSYKKIKEKKKNDDSEEE